MISTYCGAHWKNLPLLKFAINSCVTPGQHKGDGQDHASRHCPHGIRATQGWRRGVSHGWNYDLPTGRDRAGQCGSVRRSGGYKDLFLPSRRCLTPPPPSRVKPCDIKSTFSVFRCWQYGSIFIRVAVIASQTPEMSRNSKRIWPYSSSKSSKVIDFGVNGKPICDFLLVINCNFSYRFSRYSRLKI